MVKKIEVVSAFDAALRPLGFSREGGYFRRVRGEVLQALYLQPSRGGHIYYPDMLITYRDLNAARTNRQDDCHLSSRLSNYYHPDGDPRVVDLVEWCVKYDDEKVDADRQNREIVEAAEKFQEWLLEFPSWGVASEKMKDAKYAIWLSGWNLFADQGLPVPVPVTRT